MLNKIQEDKRLRLDSFAKGHPEYTFDEDLIAFLVGAQLEQQLNTIELEDKAKVNDDEEIEEGQQQSKSHAESSL